MLGFLSSIGRSTAPSILSSIPNTAQTLNQIAFTKLGYTPSYSYADFGGEIPEIFDASDWVEQASNPDISVGDSMIEKTGPSTTLSRLRYFFDTPIPAGTRVRVSYKQSGAARWNPFLSGGNPALQGAFEDQYSFYYTDEVVLTADSTYLQFTVNNDANLGMVENITVERVTDYASTDFDIIIFAGQSNMAGVSSGSFPDINFDTPDPRIMVRQTVFNGRLAHEAGSIKLANDPVQPYTVNNGVAPVMAFARYYADNILAPGRSLLLVPFSRGDTSLIGDSASWNKNASSPVYPQYADMIAGALDALSKGGAGSKIAGFMWCQGESDTQIASEAAYPAAFSDLCAFVRSDLAEPNLPVGIIGINPNAGGYTDDMIAIQEKLAADSGDSTAIANVFYSGWDNAAWGDGSVIGDETHFTSDANRLRGVQAAIDFENFLAGN